MFFLASKLLWFAAAPVTVLMAGALVGAWFARRGARFPRALALGCVGALLLIGLAPVGALLIEPLEDRFPRPRRRHARALRDRRSRRRDRRRGERGARPDDSRRRRGAPDRGGDPGAALSRRAPRLYRRQRVVVARAFDRGARSAQAARRPRRRAFAHRHRGQVAQHRRERPLHRGAGASAAG